MTVDQNRSIYETKVWKEVGPAVRGFWALLTTAILAEDAFNPIVNEPKWHIVLWTVVTYVAVRNWWEKR